VAAIDASVVLIAEGRDRDVALLRLAVLLHLRLRELHRPARIAVLLAQFGWLFYRRIRYLASHEIGFFRVSVALPGRRDDRRIDDLAALGVIAGLRKMPVEAGKQVFNCVGLGQMFAKRFCRKVEV
jgi:hypothetical protein